MLNEIKKSIQSVLYERISSPLSGALFFSWFVWNWRIPYILFFSDKGLNVESRLKLIQDYHINLSYNLIFPILLAIFLITVYPFASTGALNIWLRFKNWQTNIKNEIEKSKLLTVEQSITLRFNIKNQEENFNKLLDSKDEEIELLKEENKLYKTENDENAQIEMIEEIKNFADKYKEFIQFKDVQKYFMKILTLIEREEILIDIPYTVLAYLTSNDIIIKDKTRSKIPAGDYYLFTEKGRRYVSRFLSNTKNM